MILQALMGRPYGSIPRKTVPRSEEASAMDFAVLWDFGVGYLHVLYLLYFYFFYSSSILIITCVQYHTVYTKKYGKSLQQRHVSTGLCSVLSPLLWLLQQPARHWLAQVPNASVILPGWCRDSGLQLYGGHKDVSLINTLPYNHTIPVTLY